MNHIAFECHHHQILSAHNFVGWQVFPTGHFDQSPADYPRLVSVNGECEIDKRYWHQPQESPNKDFIKSGCQRIDPNKYTTGQTPIHIDPIGLSERKGTREQHNIEPMTPEDGF